MHSNSKVDNCKSTFQNFVDLPGFFILWTKHKNVYPQIYYSKIRNQYFMVKGGIVMH